MSLTVSLTANRPTCVFDFNITHNLNKMAMVANVYQYLWRPEEIGITKAEQLIAPLKSGLAILENNPTYFKKFNPENGWGTYENLIEFVRLYLEACEENPDAEITVSR